MLFYLDNVQSVAPGSVPPQLATTEQRLRRARQMSGRAGGDRRNSAQNIRRAEAQLECIRENLPTGLNENYARELLELHTLGVDGGYTQQDVVEVARTFTGWSIGGRQRGQPSAFVFNAWAHHNDAKTVMGREYPPNGGMMEGIELLKFLAGHPSTMRHVSAKLCTRFVLDVPPAGCIDAAVEAWRSSDGDIPTVVRAIIESPDFWNSARQKTKTPFEFVVSAVRALDASPDSTLALQQVVRRLGQPLYAHEAPTGYPETSEDWINAGAMLDRFNIALGFAMDRLPGVTVDLDRVVPIHTDAGEIMESVNQNILHGFASERTLAVWRDRTEDLPARQRRTFLVGLAIGSPEFQRQ